jgi:hypothetical protein
MNPQDSAFEALHTWVINLTRLQNICINNSFGSVKGASLNAFAQAKVGATLGPGNMFNFGAIVHGQFPQFDPMNPAQALGDEDTFSDLTDMISPNNLQQLVTSFLWDALGNQGNGPPRSSQLSQLFNAKSWKDLVTSIQTANLDAVIGQPSKVSADLTKLYNSTSTKTFDSLTDYLSTIQPVAGGAGQ